MILIATGAKLPVNTAILNGIVDEPRKTAELIVKWSWSKNVPEEARERAIERLLQCPPQITQQDFAACAAFDMRDSLSLIENPALILGGTTDKMTPPAWSTYLAEHLPNATVQILEDTGHMLTLEKPDVAIEHISRWQETLNL